MWDLLPMTDIGFLFVRPKDGQDDNWARSPRKGDYLIEIRYCADASISEMFDEQESRVDLSQLPSPGETASEVRFYVYVNTASRRKECKWLDLWNEIEYPKLQARTKQVVHEGIEGIGRRYDMLRFQDAECVTRVLGELGKDVQKSLNVQWAL